MPDADPGPVPLRAGWFPALQTVAFGVALVAVAYVGGSMAWLLVSQWTESPWLARLTGALFAVAAAGLVWLFLRLGLRAANGLRPLLVVPGPDGSLSVPTVAGWRLARETVPLQDVRGFTLALNTTPRAVRHQLVVHADQGTWVSDSVTSMDLRPGRLERSRAQRVRDELAAYAVGSRS